MDYFQLWSSSMDGGEADKTWIATFKSRHPCCEACGGHATEWGAVDVQATVLAPRSHFACFAVPLVRYMSRDLLSCFTDEEIAEYLYVGKIYDANGEEIEDYVTVRGRYALKLRGNRDSLYRKCEVCGRHVYTAMGNSYLLRHTIADGCAVYEDIGFVIKADIADRIAKRKWRHAKLTKLRILDKPRDGREDLIL